MSERAGSFLSELKRAMFMLAADPSTLFVGQGVRYDNHKMFATLTGIAMDRRLEMPVCEDFQMGFCTGLALAGKIPVCIFPRMDFLLLAANQLVNHLDKLPVFGWTPKVIIRTAIGAITPLDAGPQHTQDHTQAFRSMLRTVRVATLSQAGDVMSIYQGALQANGSTLIVEQG